MRPTIPGGVPHDALLLQLLVSWMRPTIPGGVPHCWFYGSSQGSWMRPTIPGGVPPATSPSRAEKAGQVRFSGRLLPPPAPFGPIFDLDNPRRKTHHAEEWRVDNGDEPPSP